MNRQENTFNGLFRLDIDEQNAMADSVTEYPTYEAFLDSQISDIDENYLQDTDIARELVELGYRGMGQSLSRDDFHRRKQRAEMILYSRRQGPITILSDSLRITKPLPMALAAREEANRTTRLLTIIFIRDRNQSGQEISAYIDYSHRLKFEDLTKFFLGESKLLPLPTDLSFYNWNNNMCASNDTSNFRSIPDVNGILFRCEHDRKIINVNAECREGGDRSDRTVINDTEYLQVVLYV